MFSTIRVLSGDPPSRPLEDQVRKIESPTLLISAGTDVERDFNVLYDEAAADGPVEHWNLPDAHHTHAIHEDRRCTRAASSASSTARCGEPPANVNCGWVRAAREPPARLARGVTQETVLLGRESVTPPRPAAPWAHRFPTQRS